MQNHSNKHFPMNGKRKQDTDKCLGDGNGSSWDIQYWLKRSKRNKEYVEENKKTKRSTCMYVTTCSVQIRS